MGTKFSELTENEALTGAELVALSQDISATLTSVQATLDELGDYFAGDNDFVTTIVENSTFITELTTNETFITELTSHTNFIDEITDIIIEQGVLRTTVETVATTTYTLELVDGEHKWKRFTNNSAVTLTVPPEASVAWEDYTYIELEQAGDGAVTVEGGVGVTINYNENLTNVLNGNFAVAGLKKTGLNTWNLFGNLVPA